MGDGGVRRTRVEEIDRIKDLVYEKIISYMERDMTKTEILYALLKEKTAQNLVAESAWQDLEQINPKLFETYRARLLKNRPDVHTFMPTPRGSQPQLGVPLVPGPRVNFAPATQTMPSIVQPWTVLDPSDMEDLSSIPHRNLSYNIAIMHGVNPYRDFDFSGVLSEPTVSTSGLVAEMPGRSLSHLGADIPESSGKKTESYYGSPSLRAEEANTQGIVQQQENIENVEHMPEPEADEGEENREIINIPGDRVDLLTRTLKKPKPARNRNLITHLKENLSHLGAGEMPGRSLSHLGADIPESSGTSLNLFPGGSIENEYVPIYAGANFVPEPNESQSPSIWELLEEQTEAYFRGYNVMAESEEENRKKLYNDSLERQIEQMYPGANESQPSSSASLNLFPGGPLEKEYVPIYAGANSEPNESQSPSRTLLNLFPAGGGPSEIRQQPDGSRSPSKSYSGSLFLGADTNSQARLQQLGALLSLGQPTATQTMPNTGELIAQRRTPNVRGSGDVVDLNTSFNAATTHGTNTSQNLSGANIAYSGSAISRAAGANTQARVQHQGRANYGDRDIIDVPDDSD